MSEVATESPLFRSFDAGSNEIASNEQKVDGPAPADKAGAAENTEASAKPADKAAVPASENSAESDQSEPVKDDAKKPGMVPHAALHEARAEIKELRATIAELKARPSLTTEQQAALTKLQAAEKATEDAEPDFLADPKGYVDQKVAAALKKLEESDKQSKETREQVQQQQQIQAILQATAAAEATFEQSTPDYKAAVEHARKVRSEQLKFFHPQATEQQITQQLNHEEFAAAHQALASGRNPAEVIYWYAKTVGYQPPQPKAEVKETKPSADKDAVRTLGSGGSAAEAAEPDAGNSTPEFSAALRERFRRKAS